MELKEARYILAIARQGSIGKAAESLFISQPSLSKYLKNLENQLGGPLFYRRDNCYTPTYMGERYLHYAEQIAAYGEQWDREYEDISHRKYGRLNIAIPIMMGSTIIQPTLMEFHSRYPHVTINVMEAVNFIAETSLKDNSIDLTFYNVHVFPKLLDYEVMQREEIVLILSAGHPLASKAVDKPGFKHPWIDLSLFSRRTSSCFIRTRTQAALPLNCLRITVWTLPCCCTHATARCPSNWPWKGLGLHLRRKATIIWPHPMAANRPSACP